MAKITTEGIGAPSAGTVTFTVTPERVRLLANKGRKRDLSTADAEAFLGLFRDEIEQTLGETLARVVQGKFAK